MKFKKMIILSLLVVLLFGCISSVSAGWFDFIGGNNEFKASILESNLSWTDSSESTVDPNKYKHDYLITDTGVEDITDHTGYVTHESNLTGKVKLLVNGSQEQVKDAFYPYDTKEFELNAFTNVSSEPIDIRFSGDNYTIEGENGNGQTILSVDFNITKGWGMKKEQGSTQIKSGNISIYDLQDNTTSFVLF